jgi:hypothetical protein
MNGLILKLYQLKQTVFSTKEVSLLFADIPYENLKSRLHYAVINKKLLSPRRGFYAKPNYEILELANKLYTPSYISLQTVLKNEGVIFQEFASVFSVSYLSRKVLVNEIELIYRKIPEKIINNTLGIINNETYFIATKERAFLDALYLYGNIHFDNLQEMDWNKVNEIKKIYDSKTLNNLVSIYYKENNESSSI